jgi:FtsZ-binding cell division protein ZapB
MSKEHEDTIARLMLEINRLHGDIATLAQEHTSMRARNERLEAESIRDLSNEEIKAIELQISEGVACYDDFDFVAFAKAVLKKARDK